jgi:cobalamin synthase
MISVTSFLCGELVAAAVLALWVVARYPKLGPKSLRSAVAVLAVGLGLVQFLPFGIDLVLRLPNGGYAAIFGCALPAFFGAFLAAAWMLRLLAGRFGGSNGDRGHRVPAPARG